MTLFYDVFEASFGWIGLLASSKGLRRTTLPQPSPAECVESLGPEVEKATWAPQHFQALKTKLTRYFRGDPVTFDDEPVDLDDASTFLRAAWGACQTIPRGETRSYKWLATQTGRPGAPRAAGQSMARNRLPVVIPCHRVIASDGGLGGFGKDSTQVSLKRSLLELEATLKEH